MQSWKRRSWCTKMPDPTKPAIDFSYQYLPYGTQLDNDLAELVRSADETIDALADVRRADGALPNAKVTVDSLSPAVLALLRGDGPTGSTGPTGPAGVGATGPSGPARSTPQPQLLRRSTEGTTTVFARLRLDLCFRHPQTIRGSLQNGPGYWVCCICQRRRCGCGERLCASSPGRR